MIITIRLLVLISTRNMPSNFSNFNKFLKPDYTPSYHGFSLDRRSVFSVKAGMLNLAYLLPCIQGDHHEIEPTSFIQTDGFNQANFTRMSQHLDFYFVPYTAIKSQFHEWFQQTTDPVNSMFAYHSVDSSDFLPYVNLARLIIALSYAQSVYHRSDLDNFEQSFTEPVLSYCGTNFLSSLQSFSNPLKYKDLFVDSTGSSEKVKLDKFGYPIFLNTIRLLDQARYGNYLPVLSLPIFTGNKDVMQDRVSDVRGMAQDFEQVFLPSIDVDVNILALAAYQAVCHNYYVNTYYERPDTFAYNFDDVIETGDITLSNMTVSRSTGNTALFSMNYRPWKKDIFLSALPSPQFGDVSVVTVLSDVVQRKDGGSVSGGLQLNSVNGQLSLGSNYWRSSLVGNFSVIDQVKAEALQYWRQQVGRAGYRTADRFRATFGKEPGFDPQVLPVPIGSMYSQINKDTVVGTSGDDFGDKRATGSSLLQNERIEFDCPSFGVIIGLLSVLPEADYDAFGIDKHHTYFEPFDFPTPQLQNLGLVPLNVRQLTVYSDAYYSGNNYDLGYVPEYSEDKSAIDLLHGEFSSMPASLMRHLKVSPVGSFASYVSSRVDMESFVGTTRQFYVDPAVLDNLFITSANANQNTDQFKIVFYANVRSHRPLNVLGLAQF